MLTQKETATTRRQMIVHISHLSNSIETIDKFGKRLFVHSSHFKITHMPSYYYIREVKIDVYGRPVTANAKLQVGFEGKFYKFLKVSTSF